MNSSFCIRRFVSCTVPSASVSTRGRYVSRLDQLRARLAEEDAFGSSISSSTSQLPQGIVLPADMPSNRVDAYSNPTKPRWLKVVSAGDHSNITEFKKLQSDLRGLNLHTVCEEAKCPNIGECWGGGTATIMLMGDTCTRGCRFCNIKTSKTPAILDQYEPEKVADALSKWNLKYVVLTSVDRDDLQDGGSIHLAKSIVEIKKKVPELLIELLSPDFKGEHECIDRVLESGLDVFAHNIETVERLTPRVRDYRAKYRQSLNVLEYAKRQKSEILTKTSIMLGLGESRGEIEQCLKDCRSVGVDVVTLGQYLRPTKRHLKVEQWIHPDEFEMWKQFAENLGFQYVASGPMVRSSYKAGEFYLEALLKRTRTQKESELIHSSAE